MNTILIEVPLMEAPTAQYPTVHFRHTQVANVCFLDGHVESLTPGTRVAGPAVIVEPTTTLVLYPGSSARVTPFNNYMVSVPA